MSLILPNFVSLLRFGIEPVKSLHHVYNFSRKIEFSQLSGIFVIKEIDFVGEGPSIKIFPYAETFRSLGKVK